MSSHLVCIFVISLYHFYYRNISVLHPYFKLDYIKLAWGGAEEQAAERAAGNHYARNWHEEALEVIEDVVSLRCIFYLCSTLKSGYQVDEYWNNRPRPRQPSPTVPPSS